MRYKTFIFFASISLTIFCFWLNGFETTKTTQTQNRLIETSRQKKSLLEETAVTREKLVLAEKEITTLKRFIAILEKIEFIDASISATTAETAKKESESIAQQENKACGYRARLAAQYGPLCYRLGLNDAQIDRLEIILTDHWQSKADIDAIIESQKLKETDPAVVKLRSEADETLYTSERELLGENGFKQLQEYERTLAARQFAASVAENLYFTDSPLNADQAEQLTQLLARNNEPFRSNQPFDMKMTDWDKVLEQIQSVLSAKQYAGFLNVYNVSAKLPQYGEELGKRLNNFFELLSTETEKKN